MRFYPSTRLQTFLSQPEEETLAEWQHTGAMMTMQQMRLEVPIRTGFLRESIDYKLTPKGFSVFSRAEYAKYVAKGTRPHEILPRNARALRWEGPLGNPIFARRVWHPGTMPNPFPERTREAMREPLRQLAAEIFEGM